MANVAELHHFTYGWFNPVMAFLMAFLGSLLGLICTARARDAASRGRRIRWLVLAAISIGGAGIWLMHFMAILGFDVPGSQVRLNTVVTIGSLAIAVGVVGIGLLIAGLGPRRVYKILLGGLFTGLGVAAMHFTGVRGLRVGGTVSYDPGLVGAAVLIAVVAATVALWFTVTVKGWGPILVASVTMAVAVVGMHYTGMAALRVRLSPTPGPIDGVSPFLLLVPITLLTAAALIATAFSALQAMTEEEFALGGPLSLPSALGQASALGLPSALGPPAPGQQVGSPNGAPIVGEVIGRGDRVGDDAFATAADHPAAGGYPVIPRQRNGFHRATSSPRPSTGPSATLVRRAR